MYFVFCADYLIKILTSENMLIQVRKMLVLLLLGGVLDIFVARVFMQELVQEELLAVWSATKRVDTGCSTICIDFKNLGGSNVPREVNSSLGYITESNGDRILLSPELLL